MAQTPKLSDLPASSTLSELLATIGELEVTQLDFKRGPSKDKLTEVIPAMAMTEGGLIVLGIANDRSLRGCELDQKTSDMISRAAKDVGVDVQIRRLEVDGQPIVVVAVPEVRQRIVTTPDGRLLRRIGSDNQPLVADQMARFVREREEVSYEETTIPLVDIEAFDLGLINEALTVDGRANIAPAGVLRALVDLGLAIPQPPPLGPSVTVAAAVLFASDPERLVPGASVQLVRREGTGPGPGPRVDHAEISAPLPDLVETSMAFISRHTQRYQLVVGTYRQHWPEYPEEVLREALLNALAHRDYGRAGTTVDITIWDDRIEIKSPGGLPGPITLENIRAEHYSRNRRIMRVLKQLGLVDEYGEGIDRMFDLMEARLMDPPFILPRPDSVTVTLRNRVVVSVEDQAWLSLLGHLKLSVAERRLMVATRHAGTITRRRAAELLPNTDIDLLLRAAVAKGILVRLGERGATRYELSDEIVMRTGGAGVEARTRMRQLLLDEIRRRGSLSTPEAARLLGEEASVVRDLLKDLTLAGLVEARGNTRARRYHALVPERD